MTPWLSNSSRLMKLSCGSRTQSDSRSKTIEPCAASSVSTIRSSNTTRERIFPHNKERDASTPRRESSFRSRSAADARTGRSASVTSIRSRSGSARSLARNRKQKPQETMRFPKLSAVPTPTKHSAAKKKKKSSSSFDLRQYSEESIGSYNAHYRMDPGARELLSSRVRARVEGDEDNENSLIAFCDKRIRKRKKKILKLLEQQRQEQEQEQGQEQEQKHEQGQEQQFEKQLQRAAPECINGTDLLLGACLGQGSFSSVFVLAEYNRRRTKGAGTGVDERPSSLRRRKHKPNPRCSDVVENSRRSTSTTTRRSRSSRRIGGCLRVSKVENEAEHGSGSDNCNDNGSHRTDNLAPPVPDGDHDGLRGRSRTKTPEDPVRYQNYWDEPNDPSNMVVKLLQPKLMEKPRLFANCAAGLIREGLFLAALSHPHILKVHAWTSPTGWNDFAALSGRNGNLYDGYVLILERLQGGTLKQWIERWSRDHQEGEQCSERAVAEPRETSSAHEPRTRWRRNLFRSTERNKRKSTNKSQHSLPGDSMALVYNSGNANVIENDRNDNDIENGNHSYPSNWPKTQLSDRVALLLQLSDTVKYLHKHRILHRDLKPDNLGVTYVYRPVDNSSSSNRSRGRFPPTSLSLKIFDFDVARLVPKEKEPIDEEAVDGSINRSRSIDRVSSSKKSVGSDWNSSHSVSSSSEEPVNAPKAEQVFNMTGKMGSPRYMAPEIARGDPYNLRSEVYTVGLLVHEVLTLQRPFDELIPEEHAKLVHSDIPGYRPPIRGSWGWPEQLRKILESSWGDIRQRPDMKELHSVLKTALPELLAPTSSSVATVITTPSSFPPLQPEQQPKLKARGLIHRQKKKRKGDTVLHSPMHLVSPLPSPTSSE